ncbi:MAG: hypothetical protein HQK64_08775 [Desulfamplus sp.]|nr:hypothetical protein [Desulfamplus sp.]MBF0211713.1 hypothetical protein [Desulfamplus sp.]MBF0242556.1 hypothetical protein [Desulfamplus sp.]MBF0390754.1 hypothetical protein [Desulfamplus sp.]
MKFYQNDQFILDGELIEDSRDILDCFGEFNKNNIICTKFCSDSISCAIEHGQNPNFDILEQILTMDIYQARMN